MTATCRSCGWHEADPPSACARVPCPLEFYILEHINKVRRGLGLRELRALPPIEPAPWQFDLPLGDTAMPQRPAMGAAP